MQNFRGDDLLKDCLLKKHSSLDITKSTQIILPHCKDLYTIFQKEFVQKSHWQMQTRPAKDQNRVLLKCLARYNRKIFPQLHRKGLPATHLQDSWKCFGLNLFETINDKPNFQPRTDSGQSSQICEQFHVNRKTFKEGSYFQKKC